MPLAVGQKLGPYVVLGPVAAGGMGVVYRAKDTRLEREIALKALPDGIAAHPAARARFESEAKAVAALSHPGIVAIHDFGTIDGTTFAVSELLEGETLRAAVTRGPLPLARALDVAAQVAEALSAAHEKGLVHRDLKPENVFLVRGGRAKILDFGIAVRAAPLADRREGTDVPTDPALALPGRVPGTAAYMSPEQARGLEVDERSDQFSLGVILHEMLAGSRPFQGGTAIEVLSSILRSPPAPLREKVPVLPDQVVWIVERCLRKEPSERYASTLDLARDLRDCLGRLGERPRPAPEPAARGRWALFGLAAAALAVVFGAGRWLSGSRDEAGYRQTLSTRSIRRLTERRIGATHPDVSPSGTQFAFVARTPRGDTDVFVQSVSGGLPVSITADAPGDEGEPAWSPDGLEIAFRSSREGGGLFAVEALGGVARRITTFGHDPAWHPDGRHLVFATAATVDPGSRLGGSSALWIADTLTGETRRLYAGDAMQPSVSPSGRRVAFWGRRPGRSRRDLFSVRFDEAAPSAPAVALTDDDAIDWSPLWADGGRRLRFASNRGGTMNLWQVEVDEESGRPLGAPEPITVPATAAGPFRQSPDGRTLVYQSGTAGFDLEKVPLGAGGLPAGPSTLLLSDVEGMGRPSVAPSGELLAFSSFLSTEDLWVMTCDGAGLRRITAGPVRDRAPVFSADGKSLLFHSDRGGAFEIWTVRLDGGGLAPVTRLRGLQPFGPITSPDGAFVALSTGEKGGFLLPADRAPAAALPPPLPGPRPDLRFDPTSFSPDGRLLAGHAIAGDETYAGAWVLDLATRRFELLAPDGAWPRYAVDGRRIYFLRQRVPMSPASVAFVDLVDGRVRDVLAAGDAVPVVAFDVAPDGSALYVVRERSRSQLWLAGSP